MVFYDIKKNDGKEITIERRYSTPKIATRQFLLLFILFNLLFSSFILMVIYFPSFFNQINRSEYFNDIHQEDVTLVEITLPDEIAEKKENPEDDIEPEFGEPEPDPFIYYGAPVEVDELNLHDQSNLIISSMNSGKKIFKVGGYENFSKMKRVLWRYKYFDEYLGDSWRVIPKKKESNFYDVNDIISYNFCSSTTYTANCSEPEQDIITIKMRISTKPGNNSFTIPSLFPCPVVMNNTLTSCNGLLNEDEIQLYVDDDYEPCGSITISFNESKHTYLMYEMIGLNLPSNSEVNAIAKNLKYLRPGLYKYLQLYPNKDEYISNHPNFKKHYLKINQSIHYNDNGFIVADKIRSYLQYNFKIGNNSLPRGIDAVEWFCKTGQGVWSDFATAFCVFCRAFGIPCRLVCGYNSQEIEEKYNRFFIKQKNIYNWAEIYIPVNEYGTGIAVQMDVYFDNFQNNPPSSVPYNLSVFSDKNYYNRGEVANITAVLESHEGNMNGQLITFIDTATDEILNQKITNQNGETSFLLNIDNARVVGPNTIAASFNPSTYNETTFIIQGDIEVSLTSINPTIINIIDALPNTTNVQGHVYDPVNNERVENALVNFMLFQNGTNNKITNPFIPANVYTDTIGEFDLLLTLNPIVVADFYQVRADFNGTWLNIMNPMKNINASSKRIDILMTNFSSPQDEISVPENEKNGASRNNNPFPRTRNPRNNSAENLKENLNDETSEENSIFFISLIIITSSIMIILVLVVIANKHSVNERAITSMTFKEILDMKLKTVIILKKTRGIREAVYYVVNGIYLYLIDKKFNLKKKGNETIMEFSINSVKKFRLSPDFVYPFIQKIERIMYAPFEIMEKDFYEICTLFSPIYYELTEHDLTFKNFLRDIKKSIELFE